MGQVMPVKWIQWRVQAAKKVSRSPGSSATTLCSWMLVVADTDPGPGDAPGKCRRTSLAASARPSMTLPGPPGSVRSRVGEIPPVVLHGMGLVWPLMRELRETEYQFRDDFIMDSSAAETTFGLKPTPWEEVVTVTTSR